MKSKYQQQNTNNLWDNIKSSNISVIEIPAGKEEERENIWTNNEENSHNFRKITVVGNQWLENYNLRMNYFLQPIFLKLENS